MRFMVIVYASSCFNNHLCIIGPPRAGKTTAAKAFSELLRNIKGNLNKEPFICILFIKEQDLLIFMEVQLL